MLINQIQISAKKLRNNPNYFKKHPQKLKKCINVLTRYDDEHTETMEESYYGEGNFPQHELLTGVITANKFDNFLRQWPS